MLILVDHILNLKEILKAILSKFYFLIYESNEIVCIRLFKCLIPIESICDITIVFKYVADITLEVKFDNGTLIRLDKSEQDLIIRNWTRKYEYFIYFDFNFHFFYVCRTYRIVVNERVSITDVSIYYAENTESILKLGYLSVR